MNRTALVITLAALTLVLGPWSCSRHDSPPPTPVARVVMVERARQDSWSRRIRAGAARAAREVGKVRFEIRPLGSAERQAAAVRQLVADGVRSIVITPEPESDPALVAALGEASAAGVALVIVDDHAPLLGVDACRVSFDDAMAGRLAAECVLDRIQGHGEVIVIGDGAGSDSADLRESAFRERLTQQPGVSLFQAPPVGETPRRAAQLAIEYAMNAHPQTRAVFCPNDQFTLGVLQTLRERSVAGRVKLVGVDTHPSLVEAMAAGEVEALVVRDAGEMGYRAVKAAAAKIRGDPTEPEILTPVTLVTRDLMHDKNNMDLLLPDLAPGGG